MNNSIPVDIGAPLAPDYLIRLNNRDITDNLRKRLLSMTIDDARGLEADTLTLLLDDSDGWLMMPQRGAILRVYIGWQGRPLFCKGDFIIDELHHTGAPDRLTLVGRSANLSESLTQKAQHSWDKTTLGQVVSEIAERNSLKAKVSDGLASISIAHLDQTDESDAQFLTKLAINHGATVTVKENTVLMLPRGGNRTAQGTEIPPIVLTRKEGDQHAWQVVSKLQYSGVQTRWLQLDKASSGKVRVFRAITDNQPELFGDGAEQDSPLPLYQREVIISEVFSTQDEAVRKAEAEWKARQTLTASMSFVLAMGMPALFPETPVRLRGFKTVIDAQQWTVVKVGHVIDSTGFRTTVNLESSWKGETYQLLIEAD